MRISPTMIFAFVVLVFLNSSTCLATSYTWDGSENTDWFNTNNWSPAGLPGEGDFVVVDGGATNVMLTNSTATLASFAITNQTLIFSNWTTKLIATNVTIGSGGTLTLPPAFTNNVMSNRVWIVCTNFTLETGAAINANAKGYSFAQGPGLGGSRSGAGHGGKGGDTTAAYFGGGGPTYDSINAPVAPGSGGGVFSDYTNGGFGGGAILIAASGTVTVNGTIEANGLIGDYAGGGGSGGAIFITCGTFGGNSNGLIRAVGGNGNNGGGNGGGGRIAITYTNLASDHSLQFSTLPGSVPGVPSAVDRRAGRMGTIYFTNTNMLSTALGTFNGYVVVPGFSSWAPDTLTVSTGLVGFADGFQLNVAGSLLVSGSGAGIALGTGSVLTCGGDMIVTNGGQLRIYSGPTNDAVGSYGALVSVTGTVVVGSSSWIYPYSDPTNGGSALFRMNALFVADGGGFEANGSGFENNQGPGLGGSRSGAGHGGKGGDGSDGTGGLTYGSTNAPMDPGSGGSSLGSYHAGPGGGAIMIRASGTVTVNGTLDANGGVAGYGGGGGSGGAIFITCGTFGGNSNGLIRAVGGNGDLGAGGGGAGGGRIAVWYQVSEQNQARLLSGDYSKASITNEYSAFLGTVSATNGLGWTNLPPGGAYPGTIVFLTVPPPAGTAILIR